MRAVCQNCGHEWDMDLDPAPRGSACEDAEWKLLPEEEVERLASLRWDPEEVARWVARKDE